ncbi:MAG: dihydroorotate dehydrogenase [Phycisphaerae bacterium]|nr:dihydroorotate dehydrogenase [Phycisphaerae bacterium]
MLRAPAATDPALRTTLCGIELVNPVMLAAGTCGTLDEMAGVLDLARVGGLVAKSVTPAPREGNPAWRILEARGGAGMLNSIGLANVGLDAFESACVPRIARLPTAVVASVAGFCADDYTRVAATLDEHAHAEPGPGAGRLVALELNVSCPNVHTGMEFGSSPRALADLLDAVRPRVRRAKLFVKLGPLTPEIVLVARAAIDHGADALTIANTIPAMAIDVRARRPRLANVTGGLSGPAAHPLAVRLVHDVFRAVARDAGVPIIGVGGVMNWEDAAEFILAGATAVQIGTALFADPRAPLAVARGLSRWVREQGHHTIAPLVGALET